MKIEHIFIYQYELPLIRNLVFLRKKIIKREGWLVQFIFDNASVGWGEIAPWPGFSPESSSRTLHQLKEISKQLLSHTLPPQLEKLNGGFARWLDPYDLFPSVRFGIEMAVLNGLAQFKNKPLNRLFARKNVPHIEVDGLLSRNRKNLKNEIEKIKKFGFSKIKIKIGLSDWKEELALFNKIRMNLGNKIRISIDMNTRWNLATAVKFALAIRPGQLEYIEEPVNKISDLSLFYKSTRHPYALDESLLKIPLSQALRLSGLKTIILKPMVLGGIEKTVALAKLALRHNREVKISALFESGLGILTLAHLTAMLSSLKTQPAGLDTYRFLKKDVLRTPLEIANGRMMLNHTPLPNNAINTKLLYKIQ